MQRRFVTAALLLACLGCRATAPPERTYELRGQVVGLRQDTREVRLAHDEIPGYMGAMTMSFAVKDPRLLDGLEPGDLVAGTLVATDSDAWLSTLQKTGRAPLPPPAEVGGASAPAAPAPELLEAGQLVPDQALTDQEGRGFSLAEARGRAVALTFIYTRCPLPTFCPRLDRNFLAAQKIVATRPDLAGRILFLSVSFDPAFDTPAVLKQHAASLGADLASWRFATAEASAVDRFAGRFGVSVIRNEADGDDITHNLRTAVIAPDGRLVALLSGGDWTAEQLVAALASALAP